MAMQILNLEENMHSAVKPCLERFFLSFVRSRASLKVLAKQKLTSQVVITLINNGWTISAEFNYQCVFRCILGHSVAFAPLVGSFCLELCVYLVSMTLHWKRFSWDNLDQESLETATARTVQFQ